MFADFRRLDNKAIECDLCIIGAGAAGITLARAFVGTGVRVSVLESGGLESEPDIQALHEGEELGFRQSESVGRSRLRYFGGTTNHWTARCTPLGRLDFEVRPWVPNSGWPIRKEQVDPYYRVAQELCEIASYRYDLAALTSWQGKVPLFHPDKLVSGFWQFSPPTRFGSRYRSDLEQAANVVVYLCANVTDLEVSQHASCVLAARIRTLGGHAGLARARYFVLACGGIENARILLLSNKVEKRGLGNGNDLVGRYYMDHLRVEDAAIAVVGNPRTLVPVMKSQKIENVWHEMLLCASEETQRRDRTLNWAAEVIGVQETEGGYPALGAIYRALREGKWPDEFGSRIWTVLRDPDSVARGLSWRFREGPGNHPSKVVSILGRCESAPYRDSRIMLTHERDALGLSKVKRDWRVTALEKGTLRTAMRVLGEEFGRLGLGRVKIADWLLNDDHDWPDNLWGGVHHMGTTRMSVNPKQGVVDATCRVHNVSNLYVAGSSVFPTCGYAHPTLTIVAFACRLADHLRGLFRQ